MDIEDGQLAPEDATLKWEQEVPIGTFPEHVIRRFASPARQQAVAAFYSAELADRGWRQETSEPGYAEWSREGMVISLVFEAPGAGSEWSLALFAAE